MEAAGSCREAYLATQETVASNIVPHFVFPMLGQGSLAAFFVQRQQDVSVAAQTYSKILQACHTFRIVLVLVEIRTRADRADFMRLQER